MYLSVLFLRGGGVDMEEKRKQDDTAEGDLKMPGHAHA